MHDFKSAMALNGRAGNFLGSGLAQFQVLGERASGTNFLSKIIHKNTNLRPTNCLGWKHGFPHMTAIPRDCLVVCAVRNPKDWVLSMHKRPWHAHPELQALEFSEFIRAEWRSVVDKRSRFVGVGAQQDVVGQDLQHDRDPITGARFANIIALRSAKLRALGGMRLRGCSVAFIQMEGAVADPAEAVDWIVRQFQLEQTSGPLKLPTRRLGNRFKRSVVQNPDTPSILGDKDADFLHQNLDAAVEADFGYG